MKEFVHPKTSLGRWLLKVRYIIPTLVLILVLSVAGFMLIRYLMMRFGGEELKKEVWEIWLPLVFPWIPILLILRYKTRILIGGKDHDKLQFLFQLLAWFVIGIPLFISQEYVGVATGSLLKVNTVDNLKEETLSRFYKINTFEVDTALTSIASDVRASGKYNQYLDIKFYVVVPLIKRDTVASTGNRIYCYAIRYSHQISNRLSTSEKEQKYRELLEDDQADYRRYDFHNLQYFQRTAASDDLEGFQKAGVRIFPLKEFLIFLEPKKGSFDERTGNMLAWMFGSAAIGIIVFTLFLTLPRYKKTEIEDPRHKRGGHDDTVRDAMMYLIPKHPHFVTSIILDINILVMLALLLGGIDPMNPTGEELIPLGALRGLEVHEGEWWRLITSMFVHAGIVHLIFNIYGLILGAMFLEKMIGPWRYAFIYLLSGLVGGFATMLWNPYIAGVGASGAIFGLFGCNLSVLMTNHVEVPTKRLFLILFGPFVAVNLLFGFLMPGIGNAAHIGGLLTGFLVGYVMLELMPAEETHLDN